ERTEAPLSPTLSPLRGARGSLTTSLSENESPLHPRERGERARERGATASEGRAILTAPSEESRRSGGPPRTGCRGGRVPPESRPAHASRRRRRMLRLSRRRFFPSRSSAPSRETRAGIPSGSDLWG